MTPAQVRKIKAEMALYDVTQEAVSAAVGVDPSAVSHTVASRTSSKPIREMIARMVLAAQFKVPVESLLQEMVDVKMKELFGEG